MFSLWDAADTRPGSPLPGPEALLRNTRYFLNDLTFVEQGRSATGSRFYKAAGADQWLYYDQD